MTTVNAPEFVRHPKLIAWVEEIANLTKPAKIIKKIRLKTN
ncbi:hypothetical protein K034_4195 [Acinetobacter baumannii 42057_3]|nr:hypothetical protein K034_4195 [Acinetobacter baumannii 42057_3]